MRYKKYLKLIKELYLNFIEDEITALSAQVTYYLILSFFPFLVFLVTIISYTNLVNTDSLIVLSNFLPDNIYQLIYETVQNVLATRSSSFISIGMLGTIWSSSRGVNAFIYGMNKAYRKKETRSAWKIRALSVLFTLALSLILFFSIVLVVFGEKLGRSLFNTLKFHDYYNTIWDIFRYASAIGTIFVLFIFFYIYIPNCKLSPRMVIPGALFSTTAIILLSIGFAFYVNNFADYSRIYGSIGTAIVLLIWLYWASIIVFIGSELNAILYNPGCNTKK